MVGHTISRGPALVVSLTATHGVDNVVDRVNHKLRLLLVYLVAAVRVGDVLRVGHELSELLLSLFSARRR